MNYQELVQNYKDDMIFALQNVVRINSEKGESFLTKDGQVYPFGQEVHKALETVLELGSEMGFEVKNVDNYAGHIEFKGKTDKIMGILGHLDVVPAGNDWSFDPYGAEVKDGKIYGRGTTDDKGPVISCLYAMKALKESGYMPELTIRLIIGLDEETTWKSLDYYFEREARPAYGFTCDAEFPIINGEKGTITFELAKKFARNNMEGLELRSLKGGFAPNSVADSCRVVVNSPKTEQYDDIKEKIAIYREETGYKVNYKGVGKSLEITVTGVSAHGAKPELGLNAVSVMMDLLGRLNFVNEDVNDYIAFYNQYIGFCLDGEKMGIGLKDEPSGNLIFNVGMAEMSKEAGKFVINIRYPVTFTDEDVYGRIGELLTRYNIGLIKKGHKGPVYFPKESKLITELLAVYQEHTGDMESQPSVIGGGTYAKATPNIVAYGALFPGDEDLMHQKDECLEIARLEQMTKIYVDAIYKLSSEDYNV